MPIFETPRINKPIEEEGQMHLPCVLLLDVSGSMGPSMEELRRSVEILAEELKNDEVASGTVELSVITYGSTVNVISPFGPVSSFEVPNLQCNGMTNMHEAVDMALKSIEQRKSEYKKVGTPYYRPWIFMLSDGYPNDSDNGAFERLIKAQHNGKTTFFGVGIGTGVDLNLLKSLNKDGICLSASATDFKGAFVWLSRSVTMVSKSNPGDGLSLPNPGDFGQIKIVS